MNKEHVNWAILGTSPISEVMAKAIHESKISRLYAIGSRSATSGSKFAQKYSVTKFYADYYALLKDPMIDAVYIGLPNHLHKEWIIHCAQAGKHVLCEKPLVLNPEEALEVMAVVANTGTLCMEALMYRHHPMTKKLLELIQSNAIGDIRLFNAAYSANIAAIANPAAGGSIRNLGCYPVSLVRLLAQSEPLEITSLGRFDHKNENVNQASVILKFNDNKMAVVSTADDMEMFWRFDVYGTNGHLSVMSNPWMPREDNKILLAQQGKNPQEITIKAHKPLYTYQIDVLSQKILNNEEMEEEGISLQDSLGNVTVLHTWLEQLSAPRH